MSWFSDNSTEALVESFLRKGQSLLFGAGEYPVAIANYMEIKMGDHELRYFNLKKSDYDQACNNIIGKVAHLANEMRRAFRQIRGEIPNTISLNPSDVVMIRHAAGKPYSGIYGMNIKSDQTVKIAKPILTRI